MKITSIELRQLRELPVNKSIILEGIELVCKECTEVVSLKNYENPCVQCFFYKPDEWGVDVRGKGRNCPCISSCISPKRRDKKSVKFREF